MQILKLHWYFWQKPVFAKFSKRQAPLSLWTAPSTVLGGWISAYALIKSQVCMHRQTQTWWQIQISGDFQNFLKSWMYAIGWRATLYSMLYVRHPLWVRLLTIQPLCVPGTCRGFSFMSDLFHVRFTYLNYEILELLWTLMRGIEITDFTTAFTKFLMPCKLNDLLQHCNIFLIWMYLLMENLILCSFNKKSILLDS